MTASTQHDAPATGRTTASMLAGRQADSARRRQRVTAALDRAAANGEEISVSGIARAAAVDRTFLYRHPDLLARLHALEATPPAAQGTSGPAVTRASLQADLLAAQERSARTGRSRPPARAPALRRARRAGMAPVRARRTRRHRRPHRQDHQPRAASHRPAHAARRTRPGPGGCQGREPRAHGADQHHSNTGPVTGVSALHHTRRAR